MDKGCLQFRSSKPLSDYVYGMNIVEKTTSQPNLASVTEIGIAVRLRERLIFAQPDATIYNTRFRVSQNPTPM